MNKRKIQMFVSVLAGLALVWVCGLTPLAQSFWKSVGEFFVASRLWWETIGLIVATAMIGNLVGWLFNYHDEANKWGCLTTIALAVVWGYICTLVMLAIFGEGLNMGRQIASWVVGSVIFFLGTTIDPKSLS